MEAKSFRLLRVYTDNLLTIHIRRKTNMSRKEAMTQYSKALRQGRRTYKDCVLHGRYPYLQILDEILSNAMIAGQVDLGVIEVPMDQITGTKTEGRRSAFAEDFMPLLEQDTEFADKWVELCTAHLGDEGIRDPIRCYEYMGRFFVQEGNKRVSVLKSYGAPTIPAYVIRVIPVLSDDPEVLAYYDFLEAYQLTGLYQVRFTRPGSFGRFQAAMGFEADHVWTEEERRDFSAGYLYFKEAFYKLGGGILPITIPDAMLVWLKVYSFETLLTSGPTERLKNLESIWPDIKGLMQSDPIAVSTETQEEGVEAGLLGRLFKAPAPSRLRVAFFHEYLPGESDWIRAHDLGREYLEAVMEEQVEVQTFNGVRPGKEAEDAMEAAAENGAQVIFATTPSLIGACRKTAAKYPRVKILNCSISMPYSGIRTYYSRIYEGKFIMGAIAGALSRNGRIGYVADSPIFGVPASINAFALGAQMTNPNASVELRWTCMEENAMGLLGQDGIDLICNREIPTPDRMREPWGLCRMESDGSYSSLASPYWHWGNFYVKLMKNIFSGGWDALSTQNGRAVNYWWGMRSQTIGVLLGEGIPVGVRQLTEILSQGISSDAILPFHRVVRSQDGQVRNDGDHWFSPDEILHMDWLCDNVKGIIPGYDDLLPMAQPIVRLQGIYREELVPEKEDTIL